MRTDAYLCARPGATTADEGTSCADGRGTVTGRGAGQAAPKRRAEAHRAGRWMGASRLEGGGPGSRLLSGPLQAAPHSAAAAWLWVDPLWAPSGGQHSSPLATAPPLPGSTMIEGSRWPTRGPFSRAPTMACRVGGGQGNARPGLPTPCHACPALSQSSGPGEHMRIPAHPPEGPGPSPIPLLELGHSAPGIAGSPWGNTGPTWAQPLGPFNEQQPETRRPRSHGGRAQGFCASPAVSGILQSPFLGSFLLGPWPPPQLGAAGKLLPWQPE